MVINIGDFIKSHYLYDVSSEKLINYAINEKCQPNIPEISNINSVLFYSKLRITVRTIWRTATLSHVRPSYIEFFGPLNLDEEINELGSGCWLRSLNNTTNTILDPEDLMTPSQQTNLKSARKIIKVNESLI